MTTTNDCRALATVGVRHWKTALLAMPVLLACRDITPPSDPLAAQRDRAKLVDTDISTADSYYASNVTLNVSVRFDSSEAFPDPQTLQYVTSWTYTAPTSTFYVEGGHDVYGRTRLNTRVTSDPGNDLTPDAHTTYMKMIDDASSDYLATGAAIVPPTRVDAPMQSMGTLVDVNFDGVVGSTPGGAGGGTCPPQTPCIRAPETQRIDRGDGTVRVVTKYLFAPRALQFSTRAVTAGDQPTRVREERRYEQQADGIWLLREETSDVDEVGVAHAMHTRKQIIFANTRYFVNRKKDDARKQRRAALPASAIMVPTALTAAFKEPIDTAYYGTGGGTTPTIPPCTAGSTEIQHYVGTRSIVLQHGFMSDACTWRYMRNWIGTGFQVRDELEPSLSSLSGYANQANQLRSTMSTYMPDANGILVIGHSQGGLIARRAQRDASKQITGVLTIGTPHAGAPILMPLQLLAYGGPIGAFVGRMFPSYSLGLDYAGFKANLLEMACRNGVGAGCDAQPGSTFLQGLNATTEIFPRAAIVARARPTWLFYRLIGDWTCGSAQVTNANCGRHAVRRADDLEKKLKKCAIWGVILQTVSPALGAAGLTCAGALGRMRGADYAWRLLVSGDAVSDGLIPASSQMYPGAPSQNQFFVENSDSHVAETRSQDRVYAKMQQALSNTFLLPIR